MKEMQVVCVKCKKYGTLGTNQYKSSDHSHKYYCVQHYNAETKKRSWCYIGSANSLPEEYKEALGLIHKTESLYTTYTQTNEDSEKPDLNVFHEKHSNLEWTGWDLNPRPPECKSGIHTAELPAQRRN